MLHAQPGGGAGIVCADFALRTGVCLSSWVLRSRQRSDRVRGETMSEQNIQDVVKQKYGEAAKQATAGGVASCGGGGELSCCDPITRDLYDATQIAELPEKALAASLGCGN